MPLLPLFWLGVINPGFCPIWPRQNFFPVVILWSHLLWNRVRLWLILLNLSWCRALWPDWGLKFLDRKSSFPLSSLDFPTLWHPSYLFILLEPVLDLLLPVLPCAECRTSLSFDSSPSLRATWFISMSWCGFWLELPVFMNLRRTL
ncbi:unnamed protein product [Prunus brigantina]